MAMPNILSALGTKMVLLQGADQGKVYVHKTLLNGKVARGWSCFPRDTIASFVEYLYQGDYAPPAALIASSGVSDGTWATAPGTSWGATLSEIGWDASSTCQKRPREPLDYENVFLTHARLFILSRKREVLPLANMRLKRLVEAMKEAQETTKESIFMENMHALTRFSYNPCCSGNDDIWRELQKMVSGFLVSNKSWLLRAPTSDLISWEGQLVKDVLAGVINLLAVADQCLIDKDKIIADTNECLIDQNKVISETNKSLIDKDEIIAETSRTCMQAQITCEALMAELAQCRSEQEKTKKKEKKKKKKRQALTI